MLQLVVQEAAYTKSIFLLAEERPTTNLVTLQTLTAESSDAEMRAASLAVNLSIRIRRKCASHEFNMIPDAIYRQGTKVVEQVT